jgi:chorismate-pyruvate lyase
MTRARFPVLLVAATLSALPVRAAPMASVARLRSDILSGESATQVLTRWCANLNLASPAIIRAQRDKTVKDASAETRALLKVTGKEPIRYRRVKLVCGDHVLSEADNWYVPGRLTPEMNTMLDSSDTPFGTAVRALGFHRKTLDAVTGTDPTTPLRVRALLLTPSETPFSLVIENYKSDLTKAP